MEIKRIKALNYKTYLSLDLDISMPADEGQNIILIGGANGGGKTTFFEAINGALYGLQIRSADEFNQLLNAGADKGKDPKIELEVHFSGFVLGKENNYVLKRIYALNPESKPVEHVRLNMQGNIFQYGTATPVADRQKNEEAINKIIKANLPRELSRYFLFDAMVAGNLLQADQLNQVIKDNVVEVMGFNKYMRLAHVSKQLQQDYAADRLQQENDREEYKRLTDQKSAREEEKVRFQSELNFCLNTQLADKDQYQKAKEGVSQTEVLGRQIAELEQREKSVSERERQYKAQIADFANFADLQSFIPHLAEAVKNEVSYILKSKAEMEAERQNTISEKQLQEIASHMEAFLAVTAPGVPGTSRTDVMNFLRKSLAQAVSKDEYDFLEPDELKALDNLLNSAYQNSFASLYPQQTDLNLSIEQLPRLRLEIAKKKEQMTGSDVAIIKAYEDNLQRIVLLKNEIERVDFEIKKLENQIHGYDIQTVTEPDPRYDTLLKLNAFFEDVGSKLLKSKKEQIEARLKADLNTNLVAYAGVISKVELSENLRDFSLKIFHTSGNEIYLSHLNTASKQVVVQVLLKALHEYGDYDPPVMIDTVMGVLDETSRATLLEHYFSKLSHQTILLSSDSEIRPKSDLSRIASFVAKSFTLVRDKEKQQTSVEEGYFGQDIKTLVA
jgi:DNA sulfur modification protein DndD